MPQRCQQSNSSTNKLTEDLQQQKKKRPRTRRMGGKREMKLAEGKPAPEERSRRK
jgi:hypothetical protein